MFGFGHVRHLLFSSDDIAADDSADSDVEAVRDAVMRQLCARTAELRKICFVLVGLMILAAFELLGLTLSGPALSDFCTKLLASNSSSLSK